MSPQTKAPTIRVVCIRFMQSKKKRVLPKEHLASTVMLPRFVHRRIMVCLYLIRCGAGVNHRDK